MKVLEKTILLATAVVVLANTALLAYIAYAALQILEFMYKTWPAGQTLF